MLHCKKFRTLKAEKPHDCAVFALFVFCSGAVPRGAPKSHMAFWGEEKCTLEASNRRKKLFKRRLRTYRRAFRRRLPLAKYKIQLAFLADSQRVGLYILLPLCLFRHAGAAYGRPFCFFRALLQSNEPLRFTEKSYRASRPFCFFRALLQQNRLLRFTENSYRASRRCL